MYVGIGCLSEGDHQFTAHAVSCPGLSDGEYPDGNEDYASTSVNVRHTPSVSVKVALTGPNTARATVSYSYPSPASAGSIALDFLDQQQELVVGSLPSLTGLQQTGQRTFDFTPSGSFIRATAYACDGSSVENVAGLVGTCSVNGNEGAQEKSCRECVGGPINLASGTMVYSEHDPVAGASVFGFQRTYENRNPYAGVFGAGWFSPFDAFATSQLLSGRRFVMISLENRDPVIFSERDGAFVQIWPKGEASLGGLTSDGTNWLYTSPNGRLRRSFSGTTGRLWRVTNVASARSTDFAYDSSGLPTSVTDSWGTFSWSIATDATNRRVTSISIPGESLTWDYQYTGTSLTAVIPPGGGTWRRYVYDGTDLTEVRDPLGNLIEGHTYDSWHRATSDLGSGRDISNIRYDPADAAGTSLTQVTWANGAVSNYRLAGVAGRHRTLDTDGGCTSCGTNDGVWAYDDDGHVIREQNARGFISELTWSAGQLTARSGPWAPLGCNPESDPAQCRQTSSSLGTTGLDPTPATRTATYVYGDALWPSKPTSITEASVLVPGESKIQTITHDALTGAPLTRTVSGWTDEPARLETRTTTTTLYDGSEGAAFDPGGTFLASWLGLPQPLGLRKSSDGPRTDVTDVTSVVYYPVDPSVPAYSRGRIAALRNALEHVTRYENYDVFGNARRVVGPDGVATETTHDALGRVLTSVTKGVTGCSTTDDPLCATDLTTSRVYTPASGPLARETRPGGGVMVYEYDGRGRITAVSRGPRSNDLREKIESTYDPATGQKKMERYLGYERRNWVEAKRESFAYDLFARLSTTTHPDSTTIAYTYDEAGSLLTVKDENHTTPNTHYRYDAAARLTEVRQTLGAGEVVTGYEYDDDGNLTAVTDPNGNVTAYVYDDFGQMLRQTSPVTGVTTYEYDAGGNLTRTADARGAVTTRSYDVLGRAMQLVTTGEGSSETITWGYDAGTFGIGRMSSMTDGLGTATYLYDRRGLLLTETRPIDGTSYTTSYGYDADGNRTKVTYPSGRVATATFDHAGRPTGMTGKLGKKSVTYVSGATYAPFGPMKSLAYGNGLTRSAVIDPRYRLDQLTLGTIADYDYGYDNAGNITSIADLRDGAYNRSYGYDDLNRLTSAGSGSGLWGTGSYGYDAMGNMTNYQIATRTGAFSYAGATPKLTNVVEAGVSIPVQYDAAGNELTGTRPNAGGASEQRWYTPRNSLHLVYLGAAGTKPRPCTPGQSCPAPAAGESYYEFGYDGRGVRALQRYRAASATTTAHHLYTPELSLLARRDVTSNGGLELVWFAGAPVAQEPWGVTGSTKWTFTDHLGTPLLQTNSSKAVVWRAEYEPFGNVYAMRTGTKDDQPLRFPGQMRLFDGATGTEERYNVFRWHRSGWGRYTQADPAHLRDDRNLFAYAAENPLTFIDPDGRMETNGPGCINGCPSGRSWNETRSDRLQKAFTAVCNDAKANRFSSDFDGLTDCVRKQCQKLRTIVCDDPVKCQRNTLGEMLEDQPTSILVCPYSDDGKPGNCTNKGTIFHEMMHKCWGRAPSGSHDVELSFTKKYYGEGKCGG